MPSLVVSGITVQVSITADTEEENVAVGEVVRAFDGTPRSSVRGYKREFSVETIYLVPAVADPLIAALKTPGGVTCSGDFLGGTVGCVVTDIKVRHVKIQGVIVHKVVTFRLLTG